MALDLIRWQPKVTRKLLLKCVWVHHASHAPTRFQTVHPPIARHSFSTIFSHANNHAIPSFQFP
jgi:hypothetical protein